MDKDGVNYPNLATLVSGNENQFTISKIDQIYEGLYTANRYEGTVAEPFYISMCYLTLPTEIYADASELVIYKDTATTLSGATGVAVDEVHIIDLDGFSMTQIESYAEQCP